MKFTLQVYALGDFIWISLKTCIFDKFWTVRPDVACSDVTQLTIAKQFNGNGPIFTTDVALIYVKICHVSRL